MNWSAPTNTSRRPRRCRCRPSKQSTMATSWRVFSDNGLPSLKGRRSSSGPGVQRNGPPLAAGAVGAGESAQRSRIASVMVPLLGRNAGDCSTRAVRSSAGSSVWCASKEHVGTVASAPESLARGHSAVPAAPKNMGNVSNACRKSPIRDGPRAIWPRRGMTQFVAPPGALGRRQRIGGTEGVAYGESPRRGLPPRTRCGARPSAVPGGSLRAGRRDGRRTATSPGRSPCGCADAAPAPGGASRTGSPPATGRSAGR